MQIRAHILAIFAFYSLAAPAQDPHAGHDHSGHEEHTDEVKLTADAMEAFGITLELATRRVLTETASVPARVSYNKEAMAHVGSPVNGRASELSVRLGDIVAKGDLLAVILSPELGEAESDLLQKRSMLEATASAVEVARIAVERAAELRKSNSISITELQLRQGELKKAEGDVKVAEAARLAAENRLHIMGISQDQVERLIGSGEISSRYELRAPIAGTIVEREVTPGEVVGPDREPLMVIADMATLWILADVPERAAHRVGVGTKGRIVLGGAGGDALEGTVGYVAPDLNPRTRTAQVRLVVETSATVEGSDSGAASMEAPAPLTPSQVADFKAEGDWCAEHALPESQCPLCNPALAAAMKKPAPAVAVGTLLRPGMFADVELELAPATGALSAPVIAVLEEAIQTVEGRVAVFVPADEPDTYKPQPLVIGRRVGRFVHVIIGLNEGDRYVAKGSFVMKAELGKAGAEHVH